MPPPPVWEPFPGKPQELAYYSKADELFFGGAAGPGKSALLIGLSITKHKRSLILRREAAQVKELVDQIKKFVGSSGWRGSGHGGTMHYDDRTIEIDGCEHEDSKEKYQGRPHDLIGFDEATHFSESQYLFIIGWNRHEDFNQRCRVVLAGNPPTTPEGRWIVTSFAPWLDSEYSNPAKPGELRWYTTVDEKTVWVDGPEEIIHTDKRTGKVERIKPRSRTFIPGLLEDNPILAATDYGARLQAMPEPLRSQMLYGDFNAGLDDDPWQVIPTDWVRKAMARWTPDPPKGLPLTALGVDVARGGKDKTVIARRYGPWIAPLNKYPGSATPDGPAVATLVVRSHEDEAVTNIDVIGVGSSVYDYVKEHKFMNAVPINNASASGLRDKSGKLKFTNVRAASYWQLREALDPNGEVRLMLPPDNELLADLCAAHYEVLASGIKVEPKDDIIERIGRSPDCSDAVVMANWEARNKANVFRIIPFGGKRPQLRIVVCSQEELATTIIIEEYRCLLVCICEPKGVMSSEERTHDRLSVQNVQSESLSVDQAGQETSGGVPRPNFNSSPDRPLPVHGLTKLLDSLLLEFADIDPAEHQQTWGDDLPQYGATAEQVRMSAEHGKKLWSFLTRKRAEQHEVIVIADEGVMCGGDTEGATSTRSSVVEQAPYKGEVDGSIPSGPNRSALSVACAVCDVLGFKREQTIYQHGRENEGGKIEPGNKHIFSTVKTSRGMVV